MGVRFKGHYNQLLDSKGRMSIPAPLREQLTEHAIEKLVVTATDRCLEIFSEAEWEKLLRKFEKLPQMRQDVELFQLFYISSAVDVPVDKQGRILIPLSLRKQVALQKDVVVVVQNGKIQVYSDEAWQKVTEEARQRFGEIRNLLSEEIS